MRRRHNQIEAAVLGRLRDFLRCLAGKQDPFAVGELPVKKGLEAILGNFQVLSGDFLVTRGFHSWLSLHWRIAILRWELTQRSTEI